MFALVAVRLPPAAIFCALCSNTASSLPARGRCGLQVTSLWSAGDQSARRVVFCVGGAHGLSADVRRRADAVVSLSRCVLNHQIANLVLLEQLYRAWTIIRGEPYHH